MFNLCHFFIPAMLAVSEECLLLTKGKKLSVKMKCKSRMGLKKYRNKEGMKTKEDYPAAKKSW